MDGRRRASNGRVPERGLWIGGAKDVDAAVEAAAKAMEGPWVRLNPRERARILFRFSALVRGRLEELARLETANTGLKGNG